MKVIKKVTTLIFVLFSLCTMSMAQGKRPEVGTVCKVYTGAEGLMITTCRLSEESKNEALIGFSGVDHPWNGKIFKAKVNKFKSNSNNNNFNLDYQIEWQGKKYTILTYRDSYRGGFTAYLTPYGSLQPEHALSYNEGASSNCSPERLLTEYLEQEKK